MIRWGEIHTGKGMVKNQLDIFYVKRYQEEKATSFILDMLLIEYINCSGVARPQVHVEVSNAHFFDPFKVVQPSSNLNDPAGVQADLPVVQALQISDLKWNIMICEALSEGEQVLLLFFCYWIIRILGGRQSNEFNAIAVAYNHLTKAHEIADLSGKVVSK